MGDVVLTMVPDEVEAEMVCELLAAMGSWAVPEAEHRCRDLDRHHGVHGPIHVLMDEKDDTAGRDLLPDA